MTLNEHVFVVDKLKIQQEKHQHMLTKKVHLYLYCVSVRSLDFKTKQENQQKYSGQDLSSLYFFLLL